MRILVDMDAVIVDFGKGFELAWRQLYPSLNIEIHGRDSFYIAQHEPYETQVKVFKTINSAGFFESLEPIEGAKQALNLLHEMGHEVCIVTSPGLNYKHAPSEKFAWVKKHYSEYFLKGLTITNSKYLVNGDILIDDKPVVKSEDLASWEHVLFDCSYNRNSDKKRLNWDNYLDVINSIKV